MTDAHGVARTIRPTVIYLGGVDYEIRVGDRVIGFIHRAGHTFVALAGARLDRAVECGQSLVWDTAAACLVTAAGAPSQP